ncbi:AcrR family transcriptional regulator [Streptomyces griseochromogenes]|uniref:AcrR family transcriptional regulator n=1 Tax=Streptomyces griseochromogenes TaxID=68214 RepID=A0ABS4LKA5_9ACTN|nr:TetR/AcrR family transcriptional regulator [Streptomyces griseochromogenes]MBP2047825.1 AcrR family transcriptional regulator [Streptomyces griseochromogenes]
MKSAPDARATSDVRVADAAGKEKKQVTRATYHHGALRQALIDGAREILAERGHEQFSLNEVARRAGVSTAAPYRHFSGKDELLAAVAEQGYSTLVDSLKRAVADTADARERLLRLAGAYVRFAHEHPDLFVTMFRSQPGADPVGHDSFEVLLRAVVDAQAAALVPAKPSPELMARSLWATLHGLAVLSLRQPHQRFGMDEPPEDLATSTLSAIFGL